MNKLKISSELASLILLGCLFAGWEAMLIVTVLMLIFCEIKDIKKVMTRILTFYVGLALFTMLWGLIVDGYGTLYTSIQGIEGTINSYLTNPINMNAAYKYFFTPLKTIIGVLDIIVKYVIILVKFLFIIAVLTNKKEKKNFLNKWINKYVNMVLNYINGINVSVD